MNSLLEKHRNIILANWAIIHFVGLIGMNLNSTSPFFESLSVWNLLLAATLVLSSHNPKNICYIAFLFSVFCIGMLVEYIGVHTGWLFGEYHYTAVFGLAFGGIPIIIGINWVVLTIATAAVFFRFKIPVVLKIILGALLMTFIDVLLEFFAVKHHLWIWHHAAYPTFYNFLCWFFIGILTQTIFHFLKLHSKNVYAEYYIIILLLFLFGDKMMG